jgi:tryptophan synthase alpha chain
VIAPAESSAAPSRIDATFAACRARNEAALVAYLMSGDPNLATSRAMALACVEGGADLLELGMPFSDPIADGPTIQLAAERALASGTNVARCLELAGSVRARTEIPIALMGYVNPVLSHGEARFVDDCAKAGVDAVILPDLPPEEAEGFGRLAREKGIATVFLLAPTSTPARRAAACRAASGFLYFVSVTGVTGGQAAVASDLAPLLGELRDESPVPVVVGFGVSTPAQAKALAAFADGVVVGSAIVARVAEGGSRAARAERVRRFVASRTRATRR